VPTPEKTKNIKRLSPAAALPEPQLTGCGVVERERSILSFKFLPTEHGVEDDLGNQTTTRKTISKIAHGLGTAAYSNITLSLEYSRSMHKLESVCVGIANGRLVQLHDKSCMTKSEEALVKDLTEVRL
jgi:hypothetical protein